MAEFASVHLANIHPCQDAEFITFFERLGYKMSWDFNCRLGKEWHEIYKGDERVAQIDFGVPLAHLLEDFACMKKGLPGTSPTEYDIATSGPGCPLFAELLEKATQ